MSHINLQKQAEDLSTSGKLKNVGRGLEKLAKKETEIINTEAFEWAGKLIAQMQGYENHAELSALATELKPEFYGVFCPGHLKRIYGILTDYDTNISSREELIEISQGFTQLSQKVLISSHPIGQI